MNKKEKANDEKMFQEGYSHFPFGNAQRMHEMMRKCCGGEGSTMDCCSIMMKGKMGHSREEEAKKRDEEPRK